ncbi:hypothetical protein PAMP_021589 [Pampus punctatissimus]
MWKVTFQALGVLLLAWFFGNFVLGWFQHNNVKPQTQHSKRRSGAADSSDQSCFCQPSHGSCSPLRHSEPAPNGLGGIEGLQGVNRRQPGGVYFDSRLFGGGARAGMELEACNDNSANRRPAAAPVH